MPFRITWSRVNIFGLIRWRRFNEFKKNIMLNKENISKIKRSFAVPTGQRFKIRLLSICVARNLDLRAVLCSES